ncbi:MAG: tripartite tricarboxylate transporter substrate binding protein [Betaproteobacteria bacterium]|nr:tripartite tricarboxylate transporter substrate binding protein [Betaproteobacteria bacterium]
METRYCSDKRISRSVTLGLAVLAAGWAAAGAAQPAAWTPEKAVELIAPSGPGGGTDRTARLILKIWQDKRFLEVPAGVVNKPGGGGAVSLAYLKQHTADPHFLQVAPALLLTNHISGRSPHHYTDFTPLALLNSEYVGFAVKADSPIKTIHDLSARLRQDASAVSIAVGTSLGGANHIAAALVARAGGGDMKKLKTVVFKSSAESMVAVLGGHVDVVASSASLILPHFKSGAVRILAMSAPKRVSGVLATVPTLKEQQIDAVVDNFRLLIGVSDLQPAQVAYWDGVMARLTQSDEWRTNLERNLWENTYMNSRDTRKYLDAQYPELKEILTELGMVKAAK